MQYFIIIHKDYLNLTVIIHQDDPEYLAKRAKNNEAIKRSREKARQKVGQGYYFSAKNEFK